MSIGRAGGLIGVFLVVGAVVLSAQTAVTPPPNRYTPEQDVKLGVQAASQVEQQLPILQDDEVTGYIRGIGGRLVTAIPPELRHPEFRYTFHVLNVRDINAFALPGGPMFVNRGMIEKAHSEGEIAGVMAHELSHVVLRHGTAQASRATKYEIGELAGAVLGSIIGGGWGQVISQGSQFGIGTALLRFSRDYEKQADLEGTHIMARAGYDPRDMAKVFKTIEQEGGPGGPQWLSDHPNPGNRYEYITEEARLLEVVNPVHDTLAFPRVEDHLRRLPAAPTTEEATRTQAGRAGAGGRGGTVATGHVEPPASRMISYDEANLFRVSVPANWRELPSNTSVTFAPEGAYGTAGGQGVFTHGIEIGVVRNEAHDLETATGELVESLARSNPRLGRPSPYKRTTIASRDGLETILTNISEVTGRPESIDVYTTRLADGTLLYAVGVAPRESVDEYHGVFERIVRSIELNE